MMFYICAKFLITVLSLICAPALISAPPFLPFLIFFVSFPIRVFAKKQFFSMIFLHISCIFHNFLEFQWYVPKRFPKIMMVV